MTVQVRQGDILKSEAQTLTNTVNCVGVMGKGIALAFKKRFPTMYSDYAAKCASGEVKLAHPYIFRGLDKWVLNFPTKAHWRNVSRLEDITGGLAYLAEHYRSWGITSLAVPPLGCGNGELEWRVVGPVLSKYLERLEIPVELYAPLDLTPGQVALPLMGSSVPSRLDPTWIGLAAIVANVGSRAYHAPIGRVMLQKIAYFATEAGVPTGFIYEARSYGPWSADLKPAIAKLVNNAVIREDS